jgi:hypothetical protein
MTEQVLAAIDVADLIWVVAGPPTASRAVTGELLKVLERQGVPRERQLSIEVGNKPRITVNLEAESNLDTRSQVRIDFSEAVREASEGGTPLAQSDPGSDDLVTLSELAAGLQDSRSPSSRRPPVRDRAQAAS